MMRQLAFPFLMLAIASCVPQGVLHHDMRELPPAGWTRRDTVSFVLDSAVVGNELLVCAATDVNFHYKALHLLVDGDTVSLPLSAMKGLYLRQGEVHAGVLRTDTVHIIHLMRQAPLQGVRSVGIRVVKPD